MHSGVPIACRCIAMRTEKQQKGWDNNLLPASRPPVKFNGNCKWIS